MAVHWNVNNLQMSSLIVNESYYRKLLLGVISSRNVFNYKGILILMNIWTAY